MHPTIRLATVALAVLVVACSSPGGATPTGSPVASGAPSSGAPASPDPTPPTSSPTPAPSANPDATTTWLRAVTTQALAPVNLFGNLPYAVITGDGQWITQGPVPAVFPGPLLPNLRARQVSEAGRAEILAAATQLGLLDGTTDFNSGPPLVGGVSGRIEVTVDGRRITLTGPVSPTGCSTKPCEAFAEFWRRLSDLGSWMPAEIGADTEYLAPAYALLVGAAPMPDPNLPQAPAVWPLEQPLALFGGPVDGGRARCGTVSGPDVATVRAAFARANTLTPWVQSASASATFGITVRPMVSGEDVCRELFGPA